MNNKILVISLTAPFDNRKAAGSKTHNYYLKNLSKEDGVNVKLLTFCEEKDVAEATNDLNKHRIDYELIEINSSLSSKVKRNIVSLNSKYNPFDRFGNLCSSYLIHEIEKRLRKYKEQSYIPNIIIMVWTQIGLYIDRIKKIYPNAKYIVSEHDVSYLGYERRIKQYSGINRLLWSIKYKNLKKNEISMMKKCDLIVAHNVKDKELILRDGIKKEKIHLISPYYDDYRRVPRDPDYTTPFFIFFGAMQREENKECVKRIIENIMPNIDEKLRFVVIGGGVERRNLQNGRIEYTGYVKDISPYLSKCICMVAPLTLGAGIKVKILEMFSAGVPVLTNTVGIEGIPAFNGRDYIHCESDEEFIRFINMIYQKDINGKEIERNEKKVIDESFNLEKSFQGYCMRILSL